MNEALQNLEIKVENGGSTPQGRVSAAEWNVLVAGVKALDLAGFNEESLRDYLDQYDYITRPELEKALEGIGGSGIAYPLTWSGFSQGMWDGSASADIEIPSLLSQLTNDAGYITSSALTPYATTASVNSLLTDYAQKSAIPTKLSDLTNDKIYNRLTIDSLGDYVGLSIVNSEELCGIRFSNGNTLDGGNLIYIGGVDYRVTNDGWTASYKLLHEDNYSDYALPITGGTLSGGSRYLLDVNTDSAYGPVLRLQVLGTNIATIGCIPRNINDNFGLFVNNLSANFGLLLGNNQKAYLSLDPSNLRKDYEILHSGNYSEYSGEWLANAELDANEMRNGFRAGKLYNAKGVIDAYRGFLEYGYSGYTAQFHSDSQNDLFYRWGENGTWFNWREVAFVDTDSLTPSSGILTVNGNFLATGEVTQHSSLVLKDVVDTRFLTLKELAELKPYSFYWKDGRDDKLHAGAVADYVKPILPEVISTDKDDIHSMNYANAAWVVGTSLTPYVSKHEEEIERLKSRLKYLESRLKEC